MKKTILNLLSSTLNANVVDGGPGSGDFGHKGRPGFQGGSSKDDEGSGKKVSLDFTTAKCPRIEYEEPYHQELWNAFTKSMNKIMQSGTVSDEGLAKLYHKFGDKVSMSYLELSLGMDAEVVKCQDLKHIATVKISDLRKYPKNINVAIHEFGHCMDMDGSFTTVAENTLIGLVNGIHLTVDDLPKDWVQDIKEKSQDGKNIDNNAEKHYDTLIRETEQAASQEKDKEKRHQLQEKIKNLYSERWANFQKNMNDRVADTDGIKAISDICDALCDGNLYDNKITTFGHGSSYYDSVLFRCREIWANYCVLALMYPQKLKELEQHFPKIVEGCKKVTKEIAKKWEEN